jgi:hypothetical protein
MRARWSSLAAVLTALSVLVALPLMAQDANFALPVAELERLLHAEPLVITQAEISRPKAAGDITLRADISFGGAPPVRVKLRKAEPGAESFNNVPRYDLAAYELQKLFLEPRDFVVPPTALRMVALDEFVKYSPGVKPTFGVARQALAVVQYWLNDVRTVADVYDPERFAGDAVYARHIGQLNLLTYLIEHRDSNAGNFLIGRQERAARVFSVDNGVAFASEGSDRGELWKDLRVKQLPADAIEKLRAVTPASLTQSLGVLAQWRLEGGLYVPMTPGNNLGPTQGVRRRGDVVQMGLTRREITSIQRLLERLIQQVDSGRFTLVAAPAN